MHVSLSRVRPRDQIQHSLGTFRDTCSRTKHGTTALGLLEKKVIVLRWDDTSCHYHNMTGALLLELFVSDGLQAARKCQLRAHPNHEPGEPPLVVSERMDQRPHQNLSQKSHWQSPLHLCHVCLVPFRQREYVVFAPWFLQTFKPLPKHFHTHSGVDNLCLHHRL